MTVLQPRDRYKEIPQYSLTGDLLAFHRCGLQYRYQNRGRLPPSTPVQMWFGVFIHGVMEEAYLNWKDPAAPGSYRQFPWSYEQSIDLQKLVNRTRCRPKNIIAPHHIYSEKVDQQRPANIRAHRAVNEFGPYLFPLIAEAEVALHATRDMPTLPVPSRARKYEITGVVDVLASSTLRAADAGNPLLDLILPRVQDYHDQDVEVIIDYKGADLPSSDDPLMQDWKWQLETYAWLRSRQADSKPVVAGVLLFLNELYPSRENLKRLAELARAGRPLQGASQADLEALRRWRDEDSIVDLSPEFRFRRAVFVHALNPDEVEDGSSRFDGTVALSEEAVYREMQGETIEVAWRDTWHRLSTQSGESRGAPNRGTCIACDHRTYCPIAIEAHGNDVSRIPPPS